MAQMTPQVSKLLEQALSLSVEEQEALADSLISSLGGKVDEGVLAAWDEEIKKRIADLDSGRARTVPWTVLIGILSAARMPPASSMQDLSVHWPRLRWLLSAGQAVPTIPADSCCGSFLLEHSNRDGHDCNS